MKLSTVPLVALLALLTSCANPAGMETLKVSQTYQTQALAQAKATQDVIVGTYDAELRRAYKANLDSILQYELAKATLADGNIPATTVQALVKARDDQLVLIAAKLDAKRAEFLRNPSLEAAARLNAVIGQWVQTYITDFALRITQIIDQGQQIFDPDSVPQMEPITGGTQP